MQTVDALECLREFFRQEKLDCEIVEIENRRLLIYVGADERRRGVAMEVTAQQYDLRELFKSASSPANAFMRIQFDLVYPFAVQDSAVVEVAQFLHFLNLQVELPGFYLNPLDNRILYRYVWLCNPAEIHSKLPLSIVGIAMFFHNAFGPILERLGGGKETYLSLLEEVLRTASSLTKNDS